MTLTNRDEIAGLPALSLAEFFRNYDTPIEAEDVGSWFNLNEDEEKDAFRHLVNNGYLGLSKSRKNVELIKTSAAIAIERAALAPILEVSDVHSIILKLLMVINDVNTSPATGYRIQGMTIIRGAIDGSADPKSLVEAAIELAPTSYELSIQRGIDELAYEYAKAKGLPIPSVDEPQAASIWHIKNALWETHERASLRFVIR
ncbi:hypothetical protein [Duganella qianjiadongensis]|uniref:Uncharacterized protein n=1 Tax=Duganella qianjiadongensis TaxID=2692176 RepID=A0ABW9VR91_9BURK|nr:hypothetical protein [Duganella qianjiadongensis]MYM41943.1 hypothetical protein [Duganella qianjiadongensis]